MEKQEKNKNISAIDNQTDHDSIERPASDQPTQNLFEMIGNQKIPKTS